MKKVRVLSVLLAIVILIGWEMLSRAGTFPSYVMPAPSDIFSTIINKRELLFKHTLVTSYEIVGAFVASVVIGIVLAAILVQLPLLDAVLYPWLLVSQVIPKVAVAPLLVMWMGFGVLPIIVIGVLVAFFPVLVNTTIGLKSVEREPMMLMASMGASPWQRFVHLRLPVALPAVVSSMKIAMTLAAVGAVVGEFVGSNEGLGYLLLYANGALDTTLMFASLFLLSMVTLVLYGFVALSERWLLSWHVSQRTV
jgi:NitT/TauT family transport system permease protein